MYNFGQANDLNDLLQNGEAARRGSDVRSLIEQLMYNTKK